MNGSDKLGCWVIGILTTVVLILGLAVAYSYSPGLQNAQDSRSAQVQAEARIAAAQAQAQAEQAKAAAAIAASQQQGATERAQAFNVTVLAIIAMAKSPDMMLLFMGLIGEVAAGIVGYRWIRAQKRREQEGQ